MTSLKEMDYSDKLVFIAQWYDYDRSLEKQFYLHFFPYDNTLELYDKDRNRVYLKRSICDTVTLKDMFIGNTVRVYGRQLYLLEYGDIATKKLISKANEKTLAVFKPTVLSDLGDIFKFIIQNGFRFMKMKMTHLTREEALVFYESRKSDAFMPFLLDHIVSGPIVAAELVGENAIAKWDSLMGPRDPAIARNDAPHSLRAIYGNELASNGFHGADTDEDAIKETNFFFPSLAENKKGRSTTATFKNTTCCIIKPHAIDAGLLGEVMSEIMMHFKVTALEMFYMTNANADEFLEVYKGVVSDFNALLLSLVDGPCVVLEITGGNEDCDVHGEFRKFCGPMDPDIARQIRPNTLRAKFGIDRYKNAVHCTDLPDDTLLELEYFFKILQN